MDLFAQLIISNSLLATMLALVAELACRSRANPAVVHILLLMVLVKLFTPPILLVGVPLPAAPTDIVVNGGGMDTDSHVTMDAASDRAFAPWQSAAFWQRFLLAIWIGGGVVVAARYFVGIAAVWRLLRQARRAPPFLKSMAGEHCRRMGISRCPDVLTLPIHITPAVWSFGGRARIVFPKGLIEQMDRDRLETLVAHELAHIRRKDHFVRLAELVASIVFWWHPVVWWTKTKLREMEERACDALVLKVVSHGERTYASALVETLEFLNRRPGPRPIVATAASPTASLERRFEMMKHGFHRKVTVGAVLVGAAVCLPAMTLALAAEPSQKADQEQKAGKRVLVRSADGQKKGAPGRMLFRDSQTDDGERRIVIRHPDGKNQGRMLFRDPAGTGTKRKVILRGSNDGETGKMLIRDPDGDGDGQKVISGDGTGRMLIRDPESDGSGRRIIIRDLDIAGDGFRLFPGPESEGKQPVIIRRDASEE